MGKNSNSKAHADNDMNGDDNTTYVSKKKFKRDKDDDRARKRDNKADRSKKYKNIGNEERDNKERRNTSSTLSSNKNKLCRNPINVVTTIKPVMVASGSVLTSESSFKAYLAHDSEKDVLIKEVKTKLFRN